MSIETSPQSIPAAELSTDELIQRRKDLQAELHVLSRLLDLATKRHNACIIQAIAAKSLTGEVMIEHPTISDLQLELVVAQEALDTANSRYLECITTIGIANGELKSRDVNTWDLGRELEIVPERSAVDGYGLYNKHSAY